MADAASDPVSELLSRIRAGNCEAEAELFKLVYRELRKVAAMQMARERPNHTLQPTALVHEAFLRLFRFGGGVQVEGREHFFAVAARAMRHVLLDHAKANNAGRRGGGFRRVELEDADLGTPGHRLDVIAFDEALEHLKAVAPRACKVVELHFFGGLTIEEAASVLGISGRTAKRDWSVARTWLHKELYGNTGAVGSDL